MNLISYSVLIYRDYTHIGLIIRGAADLKSLQTTKSVWVH